MRGVSPEVPPSLSRFPQAPPGQIPQKRESDSSSGTNQALLMVLAPSELIPQKKGRESPCLFKTFKTYKLVANITTNVVGGSVVLYNKELYLFLGRNKSGFARLLKPNLSIYSGTPNIDKLSFVKELPSYYYNDHYYCVTKHGLISLTTGKVMSDKYSDDVKRLGYYLGDDVEDFSQCSTINIQ